MCALEKKTSFEFAYALDEGEDERKRGVTIDFKIRSFLLHQRNLTLIDSPGHREFVPAVLHAVLLSDFVIYVFDATQESNSTRHLEQQLNLYRALDIGGLLILCNKLDRFEYSETRFYELEKTIVELVRASGFPRFSKILPISGYSGENIQKITSEKFRWWNSDSLVDEIEKISVPRRNVDSKSLCFPIVDCQRRGKNLDLFGRLDSGNLTKSQKLQLLPSCERCQIKTVNDAEVGTYVNLTLSGSLETPPPANSVLTSLETKLKASSLLACELEIFLESLHKARASILYSTSGCRECEIVKLFSIEKEDYKIYSDHSTEGVTRTRVLKKRGLVFLRILGNPTVASNSRKLSVSRVVLRCGSDLAAAGFVVGTF